MPKFKMVVLGPSNAGKSALLERLGSDKFSEFYEATMGATFHTHSLTVNDSEIKWDIWVTSGQERFDSLNVMYTKGSHVAIVMVDTAVPLKDQKKRLETLIKNYRNQCLNAPLFLVAAKCDLTDIMQSITKEEFDNFAEELNNEQNKLNVTPFYGCSAKMGKNVKELFTQISQEVSKLQPTDEEDATDYQHDARPLPEIKKPKNSKVRLSIIRRSTSFRFGLLIVFFMALGFVAAGGLAAGFIFASPAIVALTIAVGTKVAIIAGAAMLGAVLLGSLTYLVASLKKKDTFHLGLRALVLSGLLGGLAAGLLFGAAPVLGAFMITMLGLPMTIISLIILPVVISLAASALEYLVTLKSKDEENATGKLAQLTQYSLSLWKMIVRTLAPAALLSGLAAGLIFGAVPAAITGVPLLIAGNAALTLTIIIASALVIGFIGGVGSFLLEKVLSKIGNTDTGNERSYSAVDGLPLKDYSKGSFQPLSVVKAGTNSTQWQWCPGLFSCCRDVPGESKAEEQNPRASVFGGGSFLAHGD